MPQLVRAGISDLSQGLKKKQETKTMKTSNYRTTTYKASAMKHSRSSSKKEELGDAVLWHAPPYRPMAQRLSLQEELVRDLQALEILIEASSQRNDQIKKAKRILSKNKSVLGSITTAFLKQLNTMTLDLDFSSFGKVRSQEDAQELMNKLNSYLYSNFKIYKQKFFVNDMRNEKFIFKIEEARSKLALVSGEEALFEIDKLYLLTAYRGDAF